MDLLEALWCLELNHVLTRGSLVYSYFSSLGLRSKIDGRSLIFAPWANHSLPRKDQNESYYTAGHRG